MATRGRPKLDIVSPPQERIAAFELGDIIERNGRGPIKIGKAYRRVPMVSILFDQGLLNEAQYKALKHYRHHADIADRSPIRDSLCFHRGGRGSGPTITTLNAIRIRDDFERAAGSLLDLLRFVVVYDCSLSEWAMAKFGYVEHREVRGKKTLVRFRPKPVALDAAKIEWGVLARRISAEEEASFGTASV